MKAARRHFTLIALVTLPAVLLVTIAVATMPTVSAFHAQDLALYRNSAASLLRGAVPYRDFAFEYPASARPDMRVSARVYADETLLSAILEGDALNAAGAVMADQVIGQVADIDPQHWHAAHSAGSGARDGWSAPSRQWARMASAVSSHGVWR